MKNKLFSFILSFTIVMVAATALNCGCVFAEILSSVQTETSARGHCDQAAAEKTKAASGSSEECCFGCKLEMSALNTRDVDFKLNRAGELFLTTPFSATSAFQNVSKNLVISAPFRDTAARAMSLSKTPIYLAVQSFII